MPESSPQTVEELKQTLERTGFLASLAPEYVTGGAPETQHKDGHLSQPGYYDQPPVKRPHWKWYVPAYFFTGGVASGAYIIATLLDIIGRQEDRSLVRSGYVVALIGMILSPIFLIVDLGRPERFHHMLRVFRPRSMMNQGSWVITIFGLFSGLAAMTQILDALTPRALKGLVVTPLRILSWLGVVPAMYVGSYTGVLISATSVALWAGNRLLMGPLFFSSALSTGMAASKLGAKLFGSVSPETEHGLKRAESLVVGAELAFTLISGLVLGRLARPLLVGPVARIYQVGTIGLGLIVPLALHLRKGGAASSALSSILTLLGGVIMRFAIVQGGEQSAGDQEAYFQYTSPERW